jgi:hypothetical protein
MAGTVGTHVWSAPALLALSLPAVMQAGLYGVAQPQRAHDSRAPRRRTVSPTAGRARGRNNALIRNGVRLFLAIRSGQMSQGSVPENLRGETLAKAKQNML